MNSDFYNRLRYIVISQVEVFVFIGVIYYTPAEVKLHYLDKRLRNTIHGSLHISIQRIHITSILRNIFSELVQGGYGNLLILKVLSPLVEIY